jgi:hypothetical protein
MNYQKLNLKPMNSVELMETNGGIIGWLILGLLLGSGLAIVLFE